MPKQEVKVFTLIAVGGNLESEKPPGATYLKHQIK